LTHHEWVSNRLCVQGEDAKNHLMWALLGVNLDRGRGDQVALLGERAVSYAGLAASCVAGALEIDDRFPPGSRILVASRNQLHFAVGLLAALASRTVPLLADPTSPEQLRRMAQEWSVAGGIGEGAVLDATSLPILDTTRIATWLDAAGSPLGDFTPRPVFPAEPAFWTFTSGTTGEPKAVVHAHRGPAGAYAAFASGVLQLGPEDVTISTAGLPFVYALGNALLFPLMAGATAVLPTDLLLPTVLGELARHGATVLVAGPWSLAAIARLARRRHHVDAIRCLRLVLSAGEPLPRRVFDAWEERFSKRVLDNLGCTEMFNSFVSNLPGEARPDNLGRPVPGFDVWVAGAAPEPGRRGRLSVAGTSRAVAVGSCGTLTPVEDGACETGDEVAVDADGTLVFLGRVDDAFKVRGQFVRPVEVERCLCAVPGVVDCLVALDRDRNGVAAVVAKVVAVEAARHDDLVRGVLRRARASLPPFAVPGRVEIVEALSRSDRGKLQRPKVEPAEPR
jgi:acyl-coenzyme A synthetase/AMP-(fatty) acid ligase